MGIYPFTKCDLLTCTCKTRLLSISINFLIRNMAISLEYEIKFDDVYGYYKDFSNYFKKIYKSNEIEDSEHFENNISIENSGNNVINNENNVNLCIANDKVNKQLSGLTYDIKRKPELHNKQNTVDINNIGVNSKNLKISLYNEFHKIYKRQIIYCEIRYEIIQYQEIIYKNSL